jgi:L-2-hydroxycarboxylate dehydrogenase (NAD+)
MGRPRSAGDMRSGRRIAAGDLRRLATDILGSFHVPPEEASIVADVLVAADLRGIPSHGVSRLPQYAQRLRNGKIQPRTSLRVLREFATSVALDAGQGWGHVAGCEAMRRCIERAKDAGVCVVTVSHSTHFGIAAYYAMLALEHEMIGVAATNSRPHVAPTYGRTPVLGTNPIAFAAPAGEERPFVLDMATSVVAMGRVKMREVLGHELPVGWGIDSAGSICTDPRAVLQGGSILPLGGFAETGGYKGYGLALLVDILTGVLAGAGFGPMMAVDYEASGANIGHTFAAIKIGAFRAVEAFRRDMDRLIRSIRCSPQTPGSPPILVAGEKEYRCAEEYRVHGIPVASETMLALAEEAETCGCPFDLRPIG